MVVESLQVESPVDIQVALIADGVTQRRTVIEVGTPQPGVGGFVGGIGLQPVEDRQFVERQLVTGIERLLVVERHAE